MKSRRKNEGDPSRRVTTEFWEWFESNAIALEALFAEPPPGHLIDEVNRRVRSLKDGLGWEVGPGRDKPSFFAVSPNRSAERLVETRRIVAAAPSLAQWEFFPARPPREVALSLEVRQGDGWVAIDLSGWRYYLTAFNQREFFDVTLVPDDASVRAAKSSQRLLQQVATLFVQGAIGEELLIERIDRILVELEPGARQGDLSPCEAFREHLHSVLVA